MNKSLYELTTQQDIPAERNAADMNKINFVAATLIVLLNLDDKSVNNFKKSLEILSF